MFQVGHDLRHQTLSKYIYSQMSRLKRPSNSCVIQSSNGSVVSFQKTAVAVLASVVVFLKTAVAVLMRLF